MEICALRRNHQKPDVRFSKEPVPTLEEFLRPYAVDETEFLTHTSKTGRPWDHDPSTHETFYLLPIEFDDALNAPMQETEVEMVDEVEVGGGVRDACPHCNLISRYLVAVNPILVCTNLASHSLVSPFRIYSFY